jgi:hypothetical protein
VASVRELRGCHTQGRTVDETRRRIVEDMELFIDNARRPKIVDDVKAARVRKKGDSRIRFAAQEGRTGRSTCRTGGSASCESPSRRTLEDERAGCPRVRGLSHQRVHQLPQEKRNRG